MVGSPRTQPQANGDSASESRPSPSATAFSTSRPGACVHPVIRILLARVGEHMAERWTLRRAADLVGYNPSYVCWLFRQETGVNFHEWLETCRIERSANLLVETRKLITDIAAEVGYDDCAFGRAFKRCTGSTPRAFRSCQRRPIETKAGIGQKNAGIIERNAESLLGQRGKISP
jgi:AraC-like DNA-binding protein